MKGAGFLFTLIALLPHLFCCGIPIIASLLALGTTIGLGAALASNPFYNFVNQYHIPLLIFATFMVALSGILNYYSYRLDCTKTKNNSCTHKSCKPKKLRSFRLFFISLFLLILDFSWLIFEIYYLQLDA